MPRRKWGICTKNKCWCNAEVQNMHHDAGDAQLELERQCYAHAPIRLRV